MFNRKKEPSELDKLIDKVEREMSGVHSDTDEFAKMSARLSELRSHRNAPRCNRVSPDTWAVVGSNIVVTAMIVGYERANVVTSNALKFIQKVR